MLSIEDLRKLRRVYSPANELDLMDTLRQIGNPAPESLIGLCVAQMAHPDRNIRVLMLRILAYQGGEAAMRGVLAGLNDEARRVIAVAIQACPNYLSYLEIAQRLEAIVRDSRIKRKLRRRALSMLAGDEGRWRGDLTPAASAALERLLEVEDIRFGIVFGLARLDEGPRVAVLLNRFASSGDEAERAMAARALGGERIIHIDAYTQDSALHQQITDNCDRAHGRMFYWIAHDGVPVKTLAQP